MVFITFSYYATATRVMWEFNRIYRNLEGALTDAAQFAELLLDPPSVVDDGHHRNVFSPRAILAWSCAMSASGTRHHSRCCSIVCRWPSRPVQK